MISTNFLTQSIDICITDRNYKVLYLYDNVDTETTFIKLKSKNVFFLPLGTNKYLKIGEKLNIEKKS